MLARVRWSQVAVLKYSVQWSTEVCHHWSLHGDFFFICALNSFLLLFSCTFISLLPLSFLSKFGWCKCFFISDWQVVFSRLSIGTLLFCRVMKIRRRLAEICRAFVQASLHWNPMPEANKTRCGLAWIASWRYWYAVLVTAATYSVIYMLSVCV